MLSFLLYFSVLSVPNIKSISIEKLYEDMYKCYGLTNSSIPLKASDLKTCNIAFVLRETGDIESGDGYTFYDVSGTKEQLAAFQASAQYMQKYDDTLNTSFNNSHEVIFVQFTREATYAQEAVFWVVIVTFVIFIGFVLSSLILWHTDRYDLDPANSLLFVTEGNTIVSGINDPK